MAKQSLLDHEKIIEAKSKLGNKAAHIIAKDLKIEDWNENKLRGKSIFKKEKTASMDWFEEANTFKCFATGKTYDILDHYMHMYDMTFVAAVNKLFEEVARVDKEFKYEKVSVKNVADPKKSREDRMLNYSYPEDEPFNDLEIVRRYLELRKIDSTTMEFCNVKQNDRGDIAFQFIDIDGQHLGTKYRISHPHNNTKELKWFWQSKKQDGSTVSHCPIPYGMNRIDFTKPVVIVEGLVDRLSCVQAGFPNTIAVPNGANSYDWIDFSWEFLEQVEKFIIFPDDDDPGMKMAREVAQRLGEAKAYIVKVDQSTKDRVTKFFKGKVTKADPNSVLMACGEDTVYRLINDAEPIPNDKLSFLMDVEDIDIADVEKISTGYRALDNILYGSLMGCFTIISGESGGGKSTMANQICVLSPLEQGKKVFIYSGELGSGQLKNWIIKPFAGLNHVFKWQKEGMPPGYAVTFQAKKEISKYYKQNIILYSDEDNLSAGGNDILSQMEYSYKRYGCKFFLIDNLMTVSTNNEDEDQWKSQKEFIKKLLKFTNKYNVNVHLVAHPKKPPKGEQPGVYSVHGASELVNLCHRLLWVDRLDNDKEGYNSRVKIIKDRSSGKTGRECKLYYDDRTMRLYSNDQEQKFVYEWERNTNIKYDEDITKKLAINIKDDKSEVFGALPE